MTSASSLPVLQHEGGLEAFSPEPVSLATLVASNQVLKWFECVAIVQVLCRALAEPSRVAGEGELSAASVTIDLSGHVAFAGQALEGHAGVRQLAELLHGILSDDVPVPLRLAISQSLSWPPFHASLSEFSRALEYFERPNRDVIILDVYRRWEQRQPPEPQRSKREEPTIDEEPVREPPQAQPARAALPRNVVLVACAAVVVLALAISAAMVGWRATDTGPQTTAADPPRLAGPAVVELTSAADTKVLDEVSPPTAKTPNTPAATNPVAPVMTTVRTEVRQAPPAQALGTPRSQPAPVSRETEALPLTLKEAPQLPAIVAQPISAVAAVATPAAIDRATTTAIYSETDTDVVPPVAVGPQFPSAFLDRAHPDAATFDLVIGRSGSVESVKLLKAPRSIANAFHLTTSLSAAKAWRFQPAIKDGQPVRYRKTIWLPPTP